MSKWEQFWRFGVWRIWQGKRWFVHFLVEPRDIWVGVYWNIVDSTASDGMIRRVDIYVCFLPCLPLRVSRWGPR